jgi:ligand-binding SRPBCC domain-containing protein
MIKVFRFEDWVAFAVDRVFLFFADPRNLPHLMPPMTSTRIDRLRRVAPAPLPGPLPDCVPQLAGVGTRIDTSFRALPYLPFRARWLGCVTRVRMERSLQDIQVRGPFRTWHHRHEITADTRDGRGDDRARQHRM